MYDISGFGYDIRDVVRVLNLTIRRKNAKSYDVDCPFCNHKTGKLNINIEKNVFRCNYCDAHGGMLDLYSRLYNVFDSFSTVFFFVFSTHSRSYSVYFSFFMFFNDSLPYFLF